MKRHPIKLKLLFLAISHASWAQQVPLAGQLPTGGRVTAGRVGIEQSGALMTLRQSSSRGVVEWDAFNVGNKAHVNFIQPSASAVTLNRVSDGNPSQIFGRITANGQIFLTNPSGVFFSPSSSVDVGGLVATTMGLGTTDFMAGQLKLKSQDGQGLVSNQGRLTASDGGYIGLLAPQLNNDGVIVARLGSVVLASGRQMTLQLSDKSALKVQVDEGAINGLIDNRSLIKADGGLVLITAKVANSLAQSVIQNTGTIQAQTIENQSGRILLLGDMSSGKLKVDGTLDASAPSLGDGGFVETSAASVKIANSTKVTTQARQGRTGKWLVDPNDYTVAAKNGDQSGTQLSASLETTNVELQSSAGASAGSGDVTISDNVTWHADNRLTLTASNNVVVNSKIEALGSNAELVISPNTTHNGETASGSGRFQMDPHASIKMPNLASSNTNNLVIAGESYRVINNLGAANSISEVDLQGINGQLNGKYALGSDIDASATSSWNSGAGFDPIAGNSTFTGKLNGLGNKISNLTINATTTYVGLFGATTGEVANLRLIDPTITSTQGQSGAVAGHNAGSITNVHVQNLTLNATAGTNGGLVGTNAGSISGSSTSGEVSFGSLAQPSTAHGGLVGNNLGSIDQSYSSVNLTGYGGGVGGLVGVHGPGATTTAATLTNSFATGNIVIQGYFANAYAQAGGLVGGLGYGSINNAYATGQITIPSDINAAGGLIGTANPQAIYVHNVYAKGQVIGGASDIGGLIGQYGVSDLQNAYWNVTTSGQAASQGGVGLTGADNYAQASYAGFDFSSTWKITEGSSSPLLKAFIKPLTVFVNDATKTYDASASIPNSVSYSRALADGGVTVGTLGFDASTPASKNVGQYSILATNFTSDPQLGYDISYVPGTLTVSKADLAITGVSAQNKVYDSTVTASLSGTASVSALGSDTVAVSGVGAGQFADKNVGTGKPVTVTGYTLSGTDADNYNVVQPTGLSADISKADLAITGVSAQNKVYDSTVTASLSGTAGVSALGSDTVAVSGVGAGQFADKNVGTGKPVTVTGYTLSGTDADNYNVVQPTGVRASIVPTEEHVGLASNVLTGIPTFGDRFITTKQGSPAEVTIALTNASNIGLVNFDLASLLRSNMLNGDQISVTTLDGKPLPDGIRFDSKKKTLSIDALFLREPLRLVFKAGDKVLRANIGLR